MSILLVLGLIPLVGSAVVAVLPAGRDLLAKQLTLAFSLATLAVTIGMCAAFDPHSGDRFQFTQSTPWIRSLGLSFALGVDGIALVLIALVAVLTPAVVIASWHEESPGLPARQSPKIFFALLLLLEVMLVGVFAATDVLLFYVFFEAMLVPMYFLIGSFGGPRRQYAAIKFFLYSLLGGLIMLAAVIGLYISANKGTFAFDQLVGAIRDPGTQKLLFLGFFVAFAIKAPLVPFHTWLPDAGAEAPVGGAALLVGVLDKVGTFGFIRYCLPLFPDASRFFAPLVLVLSVVGILYAALLAMGQKDMKRLVAYTSVAHFGFIGLGIFAFTTQGMSGAVFYMVNHGLSTGALFLVVGVLIARGGSRLVSDYGGVAKVAPLLGGVFLLTGLSSLALPGMSTFVSEFLVLVGTFTRHRAFAVVATVGIILAALYILLLVQRTMHGPPRGAALRPFRDLTGREAWAVGPLLALVIFFGVYPKPVLDVITPAVQRTMQDAKQTDPAPTVGVAAEQKAGNR
jgi:NADH-quinone oxidoreductase subunit M